MTQLVQIAINNNALQRDCRPNFSFYKLIGTLLFCLFGLCNTPIFAQNFTFRWDNTTPITINDVGLPNAWAGGQNNAQFSKMHLNDDGVEDLVVFDRASHQVSTYLAVQNGTKIAWQHTPKYEALFPADLLHWMLLVDYDHDGRKDLFTSTTAGIRVFRNVPSSNGFAWQLIANPLLTQGFSGNLNLYVASTDLPAITDIDDDGDIDILTFDFTGNSVELHQNFSIELKSAQPFVFRKMTNNWGRFVKEHCNDFKFNQEPIDVPASISNLRLAHAGNAIWVGDLNGDGSKDLLHGHVTCTNIAKLNNAGGSGIKALFGSFDKLFPVQKPIDFQVFPSPYIEDFDGDGLRDLVASPSSADVGSNPLLDLRQSNWFYRNEGTDTNPNFVFQQPDFLQNTMLELGENATPALADADGDGDLDLFVGYGGQRTQTGYRASIWFFKNMGSPTQARFELVTTDYLALSDKFLRNEKLLLTNTKPFFADLNGDGTTDFGFWANTFRGVDIRYIPNIAPRGKAMQLDTARLMTLEKPVNLSNGENILYYDIDQDGKLDVLVSKNSGNVEFHRNMGSTSNPKYELQTEQFGGLDVDFDKRSQGMAVADLNGDRQPELVLGDLLGKLRVYQNFTQPNAMLKADTNLIFNEFLGKNIFAKVGMGLYPTLGDLDGDGLAELLIGTNTGGIRYLKNGSTKVNPPAQSLDFIVYPNPTASFLYAQVPAVGKLQLFAMTGQLIQEQMATQTNQEIVFDTHSLPTGLYFVRFTTTDSQTTRKVIVAR
ncbi:MAG: T9SS type A sorting domain-containing protein [Spirosomataceae bacterium]